MYSLGITAGLILLFVAPMALPAQEIGYIDLTDNVFRDFRRARMAGGGCGSSSTQKPPSEVTVTLVSLDKIRYRLGEEVTFEIKVLNSGKNTIRAPWTPHFSDLELPDQRAGYNYRVGSTLLIFTDPEGGEFSIAESLYGSQNAFGSLRELAPSQWFTLKGRKKVYPYQDWGKKEFADSGLVNTTVTASYQVAKGTYLPSNGGFDSQRCIPLISVKANRVNVTLERP